MIPVIETLKFLHIIQRLTHVYGEKALKEPIDSTTRDIKEAKEAVLSYIIANDRLVVPAFDGPIELGPFCDTLNTLQTTLLGIHVEFFSYKEDEPEPPTKLVG